MIVLGERWRWLSHTYTCIHSPPWPSRLPQTIEQHSVCYTVGPRCLSILNITEVTLYFWDQSLKKNYFNWRLITLQYCGGFAIYWHESATDIHVSPRVHPPTMYTGFECRVSCIELELVIYFTYGNTQVSMLFSQIIPPLPFPTESKSLIFISVSLLLSCI